MSAIGHELRTAKLDGLWKDLKSPTEEELREIISNIPYLARKAAERLISSYPSFDNCMFVIDKIGDRASHDIRSKPDELCIKAFTIIIEGEPTKEQLIAAIKLFRDRRTSGTKEYIENALLILACRDMTKEELIAIINSFVCLDSFTCQHLFVRKFLKIEKEPSNKELFSCYRVASSLKQEIGQMILSNNPSEEDLLSLIREYDGQYREIAWSTLKKNGPSEDALRRILIDSRYYAYEAAELWLAMNPDRNALSHMVTYIDNGSSKSSPLHISICEKIMMEYPDERTFPHVIFYCKDYETRVKAARNWLKLKRGNPNRNQVRRAVIHNMWSTPIAVEFAREMLKHSPSDKDLKFLLETPLKHDNNSVIKSHALKKLRGFNPKDNQEIIQLMKDPSIP